MTPEKMEHEIEVLKRQVRFLRNRTRDTWELLDVLATPPWRRIWFTLLGWHPWKVGRWYGKG
ncbi:MAG: hypothetical protein Q8P12_07315 [bacterium]|nr:hypothetical protein [bacterium]